MADQAKNNMLQIWTKDENSCKNWLVNCLDFNPTALRMAKTLCPIALRQPKLYAYCTLNGQTPYRVLAVLSATGLNA